MNKPKTDQEKAHWLLQEFYPNADVVESEDGRIFTDEPPFDYSSWNPLAKENLWQMMECVEKLEGLGEFSFDHLGFKCEEWRCSIRLDVSDDSVRLFHSDNESLNHAIYECLWSALND